MIKLSELSEAGHPFTHKAFQETGFYEAVSSLIPTILPKINPVSHTQSSSYDILQQLSCVNHSHLYLTMRMEAHYKYSGDRFGLRVQVEEYLKIMRSYYPEEIVGLRKQYPLFQFPTPVVGPPFVKVSFQEYRVTVRWSNQKLCATFDSILNTITYLQKIEKYRDAIQAFIVAYDDLRGKTSKQ